MPRPSNPLDTLADSLAAWIDEVSSQMAEAIIGGMSAPFSAHLSTSEKLDYYAAQFFNPDGSPNLPGRAKEMQRMGPELFAETFEAVLRQHPDWRRSPQPPIGAPLAPDGLPTSNPDEATGATPTESVPMPSGPIAPDGLPTRV